MSCLDLKEFRTFAEKNYNVIPVFQETVNDFETPVSAYLKVGQPKNSFLLESVEGPERSKRYSIIGLNPVAVFSNQNKTSKLDLLLQNKKETKLFELQFSGNLFEDLSLLLRKFRAPAEFSDLPVGLVGSLAYESVNFIESSLKLATDRSFPEASFFLTGDLLIFDHRLQRLKFLTTVYLTEEQQKDPEKLEKEYLTAKLRIEQLKNNLKSNFSTEQLFDLKLKKRKSSLEKNKELNSLKNWSSNFSQEEFIQSVESAKEYIRAGDAFQIVLSQKLTQKFEQQVDLLKIYRLLRVINPSPYLFLLNFENFQLIGSSPETLTRTTYSQEEQRIEAFSRPIAGTYPRGKSEKEDQILAQKLKEDPKELSEHLMLVDLARNDLGRVGIPGTVKANQLMFIEKYSHVLHLVSEIKADLKQEPNKNSIVELIKAVFPHGTLSGAPKVKAMEIISQLEKEPRGFYGGAVGSISFSGLACNLAIAIRTLLVTNNQREIKLQAGCGVVYDSDPLKEYLETLNKAAVLIEVIECIFQR